jgi:von Willebrand factor A domain-containing protein 8
MKMCKISPVDSNLLDNNVVPITMDKDYLTIGKTKTSIYKTAAVTKVPDILFYDVPQHVRLMENLLQVST